MSARVCTLLFLRRGDELLLAMKKRGFGAGRWNGVGGKVDPGESIEQALVRECQEEIGVTPISYSKVAEHGFILDSEGAAAWEMHVHTYIASVWAGEPSETEEMAPRWFKITEIPYHDMWQDDKYWLPQVLEGKILKTLFTFDGHDNLLSQKVKEVESL